MEKKQLELSKIEEIDSKIDEDIPKPKNNVEKLKGWFSDLKENLFSQKKEIKFSDKLKFSMDEKINKLKEISGSLKTKIYKNYQIPKKILNEYYQLQMEKILLKFLKKQPNFIKSLLIDDYMFDFVKRFLNDVIDEFWPDIEQQVLFQFRLKFHKPEIEIVKNNNSWFCLSYFRNFILYSLYPYDKSIWEKMRYFRFWVLIIIQAIPFYGIQQFMIVWLFLLIDKSDEYQLVDFILNFKKLQFLSMGISSAIVAYFFYFNCLNFANHNKDINILDCSVQGPQKLIHDLIDTTGFIVQIIFTWISYFLVILYSKPKGNPSFNYIKENFKKSTSKSRRLGIFMIFELINDIISIIWCYYFYKIQELNNINNIKSSIYFIKVVYGLLSFPFFIFIVPQLIVLFTNSRETMYDKEGNCVPAIYDFQKEEKEKDNNKYKNLNENIDEFLIIDEE